MWPSFETRASKSAVADFDTIKCRSRARPTSVRAPQDEASASSKRGSAQGGRSRRSSSFRVAGMPPIWELKRNRRGDGWFAGVLRRPAATKERKNVV
jgi:hypothetical protein